MENKTDDNGDLQEKPADECLEDVLAKMVPGEFVEVAPGIFIGREPDDGDQLGMIKALMSS